MEHSPVFDFDYFADPILKDDVHAGYLRLKKEAPPVFWTPHNGGHWVVTTATAATRVLQHPEIFSNGTLTIPINPQAPKFIPESLDPPEHRRYRQMLRPFFESKAIEPLEPRITQWTEQLIDTIVAQGECEFVEAIASRLPVSVFMELFGFPLDRFDFFRDLVNKFFNANSSPDERNQLTGTIMMTLAELIEARRVAPRDDLISKIVHLDFEGRKLDQQELMSIAFLMFLAGLDTVTNAMSFGMKHLAHDAALRQKIMDDPACIPDVVEELLRRYPIISPPRIIVQDTELEGAKLSAGECILVPTHMVGWDEKLTSDPETVSLDRPHCRHAAFGAGIHTCLGIHLARLELAVFYRIWFKRIGHFHQVDTGTAPKMRAGSVQAMETLPLGWAV